MHQRLRWAGAVPAAGDPSLDSPPAAVERLEAVVLAPPSPELEAVRGALAASWELRVTDRPAELEAVDPGTRLVVLDDRSSGPLLGLARTVLERAASATVVLIVGPSSIGEIVSAGLEGLRVGWLFRPLTPAAVAAELRDLAGIPDGSICRPASERRAFPRASLEEPSVLAPAGVDLCDISPGGARLIAPPGWTAGGRHELELRLTSGAPVQRVVVEITRAEPAALGRQAVAARFVEPTGRFQSLVRATILEHMTFRELRKLLRRFREEASGCAPIRDANRIQALLREFHEHQRPCIVSAGARGRPWRSPLRRVDAAGACIELAGPPGGARLRPGDGVDVFLHGSAESYLFEVRVVEVGDGAISCTWPEVVQYSEKRFNKRRTVPPEAGVHGRPNP